MDTTHRNVHTHTLLIPNEVKWDLEISMWHDEKRRWCGFRASARLPPGLLKKCGASQELIQNSQQITGGERGVKTFKRSTRPQLRWLFQLPGEGPNAPALQNPRRGTFRVEPWTRRSEARTLNLAYTGTVPRAANFTASCQLKITHAAVSSTWTGLGKYLKYHNLEKI